MRMALLASLGFLAACATPPEQLSTPELCYVGLTDPARRPLVEDELRRRHANCQDQVGELAQMADYERRARGTHMRGPLSGAPRCCG